MTACSRTDLSTFSLDILVHFVRENCPVILALGFNLNFKLIRDCCEQFDRKISYRRTPIRTALLIVAFHDLLDYYDEKSGSYYDPQTRDRLCWSTYNDHWIFANNWWEFELIKLTWRVLIDLMLKDENGCLWLFTFHSSRKIGRKCNRLRTVRFNTASMFNFND